MTEASDQLWAAFFHNVMRLPIEGPRLTEAEILERKAEFVRAVDPTFGKVA